MAGFRGKAKIGCSVFIAALVCLFAAPVFSETINLPATGQKTCYNTAGTQIACAATGQDGEFQSGVAWPSPRFSQINSCATVDNLTKLMWARNTMIVTIDDWLTAVAAGSSLNYCGYNDWRAANVNELESLVSAGAVNFNSWLGSAGFKMQPISTASLYFSSTFSMAVDASTSSPLAWGFPLSPPDGSVAGLNITNQYYVWPVRSTGNEGKAAGRVAQTGQTTCYDSYGAVADCSTYPGQDGQWMAGAAWPDNRFTDNGDGTVSDAFTGLMWTADAGTAGPDPATTEDPTLCVAGAKKNWEEALQFVQVCLNSATDNYLGYRDWRLPNKNELPSLLDLSFSPALPISATMFTNVVVSDGTVYPRLGGKWSSTTSLLSRTAAWITDMTYGAILAQAKSTDLHVWPVRGGYWLLTPVIVSAGGSGSGTITKSPVGVGCASYGTQTMCDSSPVEWPAGSARFTNLKKVTVTAKPDKYSVFSGWTSVPSDLCAAKASCTITMVSDATVTANFTSQPTLYISPTTKSYGKVKTGKTSNASFTVTNKVTKGKQNLTVNSLTLGGTNADQFSIDASRDKCTGMTLVAGKSCTFTVIFTPTTVGYKTATVTVASADDPSGTTNVTTLSGTAMTP